MMMHLSKIIISLFFITTGGERGGVASVSAFRRTTATTTDTMLSLPRGGAGPIDTELATKIYAVCFPFVSFFFLSFWFSWVLQYLLEFFYSFFILLLKGTIIAQGTLDYLSPKTIEKLYNFSLHEDPVCAAMQFFLGCDQLGTAIMLFFTVFRDVPGLQAVGYGLIPIFAGMLKSALDGSPKELGMNVPLHTMNLAIQGFVTFSLVTGADHAVNILKCYCIYVGLLALQCRFLPQSALEGWGIQKEKVTEKQKFATKILGQAALTLTAVMYTLGVQDGSTATTVGRIAVILLASLVEFINSGTFTAMGVDLIKCYPWLVISTVVALTLLL